MEFFGFTIFSKSDWEQHQKEDLIVLEQKRRLADENNTLGKSSRVAQDEWIKYKKMAADCEVALVKKTEECKPSKPVVDELEERVTSKYPKQYFVACPSYPFKHAETVVVHDPRYFLATNAYVYFPVWTDVSNLKNNDDKATRLRALVRKIVGYQFDHVNYGVPDFWADAQTTIALGYGDCDDQAIVLANALLKAGIPYYRVRLCIGWVRMPDGKKDLHCYVTYLREKDNEWVVLDTCFDKENYDRAVAKT